MVDVSENVIAGIPPIFSSGRAASVSPSCGRWLPAARTAWGSPGDVQQGDGWQAATLVASLVLTDDFGADPAAFGYFQAVGLRPGADRGIVVAIGVSGDRAPGPRRYAPSRIDVWCQCLFEIGQILRRQVDLVGSAVQTECDGRGVA